jgi:hypothetical protein
MYRPEITPIDSAPQPSSRGILASFAIVLLLSLVGLASVLVTAYFLPDTGTKAYWFISRSSGVVAYVLITVGVLWGLVQSGGLFRRRITPVLALGIHSYLSWIGLGLAGLHGVILIGDGFFKFNLPNVLTPFISPYRPIPVGLGIIGFYLMLLLSLSFYARMHLGQKNFRLLHYGTFGVFVMVTLHSLFSGTDTKSLWWLYTISLAAVVSLTGLRIVATRRAKMASSTKAVTKPAALPQAIGPGTVPARPAPTSSHRR